MNSKTFSLLALGILALVLTLGLASAATIFSDNFNTTGLTGWTATNWSNTAGTYAESTNQATSSLSRTIGTSGYQTITVAYGRQLATDWETTDNFKVSWSVDGTTFTTLESVSGNTSDTLPNDTSFVSKTFTLPSSANNNTNFQLKFECSTSATDEYCRVDNLVISGSLPLTESSICAFTGGASVVSQAEMVVDIGDITVLQGFGEDEEWLLFDEVEVEFKVENNGDFDLDDITVEWAIANDALTDFAIDFDEVDEVSIKDGDEETLVVSFFVDDDDLDMDLEELSGLDYNLVFRAVGTIDDPDQGSLDGTLTCAADFRAISVQEESDFVILTDLNVPETVTCGQNVQITGNVLNLGDSQQDEVKVEVYDKNKAFIDELFQVGDIDEFDNTELSFSLAVPKNADVGAHTLVFRVLDENSDVYENDFDEDPSEVFVPFTISGGCVPEVTVTASTVSGSQEGKKLVVKTTITNSGDSQAVYALSVSGSDSWASSASVDQSSLVLAAGESKDVLVTFDVGSDSEGSQTFSLDLVSEGQVTSQPVTVSISPSGLFGITGNSVLGGPAVVGLGILVLILIIAIIVVAVRRK